MQSIFIISQETAPEIAKSRRAGVHMLCKKGITRAEIVKKEAGKRETGVNCLVGRKKKEL